MNGHGNTTSAQEAYSLLPALLDGATLMNFYRFCELLEQAAPDQPPLGATDSPAAEPVRFRSRARIGFPNREIDAVEYDPDRPAAPPDVRTTFLGLYGVDARMPSYFVDEIAQNREGADALSGFLDLFHHRIATQYYRVWRKYRYPAGFRPEGSDAVSRYLLSFAGIGLGDPEIARAVGIRKLLSMLGLAVQKTRTAEGLAGVLRHAVPDAHVMVEECHPVWIRVEKCEPGALGDGCLLGREFCDRANTVRVVIRPDTRESVLALMPGQSQHRALMALLRFYLGYEANACLEMHVAPVLMPGLQLNSAEVSLGYTSQLSLPDTNTSTTTVVRVQLGKWTGGGADPVAGW